MSGRGLARLAQRVVRLVRRTGSFVWWAPVVQRLRRIAGYLVLFFLAEAVLWTVLVIVFNRAGPRAAETLYWALVALGAAILLRRPLRQLIRSTWVKHRFRRAVLDAKLVTERNRIPVAFRMREVPTGDRLLVGIPSGMSVESLERSGERIAVTMGPARCVSSAPAGRSTR